MVFSSGVEFSYCKFGPSIAPSVDLSVVSPVVPICYSTYLCKIIAFNLASSVEFNTFKHWEASLPAHVFHVPSRAVQQNRVTMRKM